MCQSAKDLAIANHERSGYYDPDDGAIYLPRPFEDTYIVRLEEICVKCRNAVKSYAEREKKNKLRG